MGYREEIMQILEAFDLTNSYRAAGELADSSPTSRPAGSGARRRAIGPGVGRGHPMRGDASRPASVARSVGGRTRIASATG